MEQNPVCIKFPVTVLQNFRQELLKVSKQNFEMYGVNDHVHRHRMRRHEVWSKTRCKDDEHFLLH